MKPKITVVTTTIHVPEFLTAYSEDARKFGHDVDFIVIGDQKSPVETREFCQTIPYCEYLDVNDQLNYLTRFPELRDHLPFNSFERRDIGILWAYENGADVMVTIDDDNLLASEDVFTWHNLAGRNGEIPVMKSSSGWFNVCSLLKEENDVEFYHRGYSPRNKWNSGYESSLYRDARVVVNAGLWYNNPDTDAVTRLERSLNVIGFSDESDRGKGTDGVFGLAPGTWSPFNCQNTAIARRVLPAYFMSPYIGRHSDIFASYVVARIAEHFGDVIAFGMPLANHARSTYPHSLYRDLDTEIWGMQNTDLFCDTLRSIKLTASTYHEAFGQIITDLKSRVWTGFEPNGYWSMIIGMEIWHETMNRIRYPQAGS